MCKIAQNQIISKTANTSESRAINTVSEDVEVLLKDKSYSELVELENKVEKLINGDSSIDVDFWNELRKELIIRKARVILARFHKKAQISLAQSLKIKGLLEAGSQQSRLLAELAECQISIPYHEDMDRMVEGVISNSIEIIYPEELEKSLVSSFYFALSIQFNIL